MIGTIQIEVNAKNPNMPLWPLRSYVDSPSSLRIANVPKKIGNWQITSVNFQVTYPDGAIASADCVLVGGVWVGTVDGTSTPGKSDFGYAIYASGIDEHGNPVTGYCLGKGDVEILDDEGSISPSEHVTYTTLLSAMPENPKDGYIFPLSGEYYIWQNGQANLLGTPFEQISAYVESAVSAKADLSTLEDYIPYTIDSSGYKTAITIGTRKPDSSVGQFSFSTGANNAAEAMQTVTMGFNNKAQMQDSIAIGQSNNVAGSPAVAIGKSNNVSCINGVCIGANNTISGTNAVAIGTMNNANGDYAIAMGGKARANSDGSFTWSGSDKINVVVYPQYFDHGKGTFNVNPAGGLSGFYVGEQSLNDILSAKADLSAIHGDYITNGESTISANRAWSETRGYVWTVTINSGTYVLSCNEDGTSTWDQCELLEDGEGYKFYGRTIGCYEDDILFFKLEYDIEGAVFHLTMKDKRDSWPADEYTLVPDEPLMQYLPHGPFGNWDAIVSYMPWTKTGILTTKDYVDEAIETYAVQNLGGVAKIQSMELSDYQAISATADLSTLYVIPEET